MVLQVLSGIVRAGCKRHTAGSSCEPVGQLTFQGPKSLCVLDKLFIVVLALPGPPDSNKWERRGNKESTVAKEDLESLLSHHLLPAADMLLVPTIGSAPMRKLEGKSPTNLHL